MEYYNMKKILLILIGIFITIPNISYAQLNATQGGTGLSTYTLGDIIYAASTNPLRFTKLGIGSAGTCLGVSGGIPAYIACGSGGSSYPFTPATNYNQLTSATSSALWIQNNLFASSSAFIAGTVTASNFNATGTAATSTYSGNVNVKN